MLTLFLYASLEFYLNHDLYTYLFLYLYRAYLDDDLLICYDDLECVIDYDFSSYNNISL